MGSRSRPIGDAAGTAAIQLGLRGNALASYAREWIVDIQDISAFVAEQEQVAGESADATFVTPRERVYPVADPTVAARLAVSTK